MFEMHDAIVALPGSTPARQLLVTGALEYLDGLAREASGDASLQRELANAYKYLDVVISKEAQEALTKPPYNFIPVNKDVVLPADLPMKNLEEITKYVEHDWSKINPLRAGWIEKSNKEMAK